MLLSVMYLFVFLCFLCVMCVCVFFLCLTLDGLFSFEIFQSWVRLSQILWCALFHNADSMCYSSKTTRPLKELCAAASSPFTRKETRFRLGSFSPSLFSCTVEHLMRYEGTHLLWSWSITSSFDLCDDLLRITDRLCPFAVLLVSCCLSESN